MAQRPPEHIEREMFEIRTSLDPDMTDLRKHLQPSVIADQAKSTVRERLENVSDQAKGKLKHQQREIQDSAGFQYSLARKAATDRDTGPLTDAVRNDPRPVILLVMALVPVLTTLVKVSRRVMG